MSSGKVRKVTPHDIEMVQNLIEQYLPFYMTQMEVKEKLLDLKKIEPTFTELVWQRLEEQNQEFFRAYHMRMMLKDQITEFNQLLQKQAKLMKEVTHEASLAPMSNGSHLLPRNGRAAYFAQGNYGPALRTGHMQQHVTTNLQGIFTNRGSSISPTIMRSGPRLMHGTVGNALGTCTAIGDASPFSSVESNSQLINEAPFADMPSTGLFGDCSSAYDIAELSGMMGSLSGSPYREDLGSHHGNGGLQYPRTFKDFSRA